jgi:tryptophan halogenase
MNIVVCGGGTAGWLAAYIIGRSQRNVHKITVIESSAIGIIGAGEGSTGILYDLLSSAYFDSGVDISDFMEKTDSTRKVGIRHVNWTGDGTSYFAPLDGSPTSTNSPDVIFHYVMSRYGKQKMHLASPIGQAFEQQRVLPYGGAFHFDGHKVGAFFKSICEKDGATHIDAKIEDVVLDSTGAIASVILDDNRTVDGDFFIDCTGFARVLMNKLEVKWKSYADHLPVNRAMPFIVDYESKDSYVEPVTTATTLSSGWVWNIPLSTRIGSGYVYNKDLISDDQAKLEVEKLVGKEITPIKIINFTSGRSEELWKKNCLALGLSAAFSEPLEATSIHSTIMQLLIFAGDYLTPTPETTNLDINRKLYNEQTTGMYDDLCDFLIMHYKGGRSDTEFWKHVSSDKTNTAFVTDTLERCKTRTPSLLHYSDRIGAFSQGWTWILAGTNKITPEMSKEELDTFSIFSKAADYYQRFSLEFTRG